MDALRAARTLLETDLEAIYARGASARVELVQHLHDLAGALDALTAALDEAFDERRQVEHALAALPPASARAAVIQSVLDERTGREAAGLTLLRALSEVVARGRARCRAELERASGPLIAAVEVLRAADSLPRTEWRARWHALHEETEGLAVLAGALESADAHPLDRARAASLRALLATLDDLALRVERPARFW